MQQSHRIRATGLQIDSQLVFLTECFEVSEILFSRWVKHPKHERGRVVADGNLNLRQTGANTQ